MKTVRTSTTSAAFTQTTLLGRHSVVASAFIERCSRSEGRPWMHQADAPLDLSHRDVRRPDVEMVTKSERALLEERTSAAPGVPSKVGSIPRARTNTPMPFAPGVGRAGFLVTQAMALFDSNRSAAWGCLRDASTLLRRVPDSSKFSSPASYDTPRGGLAPWQAKRLMSYVESNLGTKMMIRDLAEFVCLSPGHLSRAFKQQLGCTPMTYVAARRIERAKIMITSTREDLSRIA
jgi:AraC-like DNA-binding protein